MSRYVLVIAFVQCITYLSLSAAESGAQSVSEIFLSIKWEEVSMKKAMSSLETETGFNFLYKDSEIRNITNINMVRSNVSLKDILMELSRNHRLQFKRINQTVSVIKVMEQQAFDPVTEEVDRVLNGKVTDFVTGESLPGASVLVKGTTVGTITDYNGNFTLSVPDNAEVLLVSFVGYDTEEVSIGDQTSFEIAMIPDIQSLSEVVVVGYGTQKKANITGAAATVQMDEVIGDRPENNAARALQGAVPGLQVSFGSGRPGTDTDIQLRGFESINGGEPLILMDNVPVELNDINPRDIESVTVLKDAAAASIYGARASFGVVLITTKKAKKDQPARLSYSNVMSISDPTEIPKAAKTADFVRALNSWGHPNLWTGQDMPTWLDFVEQYEQDPSAFPLGYAEEAGTIYPLTENNPLDEFLDDPGFTHIHNLNVSGGSAKSAYRISLGYSDEDGVMVTSKDRFTRYNLNTFLSTEISDKLSSSLAINYRASTRLDPTTDYYRAITFYSFSRTGSHEMPDGTFLPYDSPANLTRLQPADEEKRNNLRLTGKLDFNLLEGLTITTEYTYENRVRNFKRTRNNPETFSAVRLVPNDATAITSYNRSNENRDYYALNLYAKYSKSIDDHNFDALVGMNRENSSTEFFSSTEDNLISTDLPSLSVALDNPRVSDSFGEWAVAGYFGRINYNYKQKYFLELNGRYDGSSRFPSDDRFGFFPSVSAGWQVMSEPFLSSIENIVNGFKIRGSWGEIGNQNIVNAAGNPILYPFLPTLDPYQASWINPAANQQFTSLRTPGLVSSSFTWETVQTLNLGLDAEFFDNKLAVTFDRFIRKTLDMLAPGAELPAVLGASAPRQNVADLETNGWELQMDWRDEIGQFKYSIGFNLFDNQAEITKFDNEEGLISQYYVGQEIGEIWGYETDGFYTIDDFVEGTLNDDLTGGMLKEGIPAFQGVNPNPGDIKYKDLNGDGEIFSGNGTLDDPGDRKIIGNSTRRYQFGVFGSAGFKGFDLSFRIVGVGKRERWISNNVYWPFLNRFNNVFEHHLDYWTPENTDAFYPRVYEGGGGNYPRSREVQTRYLSDGAFWKLQNITIGYTLPKQIVNKIFAESLRVYVSAENLIDNDKLPDGIHPEFQNFGFGGTYPYLRSYAVGLNITF